MPDKPPAASQSAYPWLDDAIAVRRARRTDPFSTFVIAQGRLAHVVAMISALPAREQALARVSLPHRADRPFLFEEQELQQLIAAFPDAGLETITQPLVARTDPPETR